MNIRMTLNKIYFYNW